MKHSFLLSLTIFVIICSFPSCKTSASGDATNRNGKLYLRSYFYNGLSLSWIYLGNDGNIVRDPKNGVDPLDINLEKQNNVDNVGTYKLSDKNIHIIWNNGTTADWLIEREKGEISAMDGGIVTLQTGMPKGYMLDGQYAASAILPNVAQVQTFVFKKDGTFTLNTLGAVETPDYGTSAEGNKRGTYSINGNTMRINFADGSKIIGVITVFGDESEKKYLVLNNSSFPQEK